MENLKTKVNNGFKVLKESQGYKNTMQSPRIQKVVISVGVGSLKDKNKLKLIQDRLLKITGQKSAPRGAKISIANFKSREGDVVGYQVTLRGTRMYDFLEKLIHISLPRTKDFRGISMTGIDDMGNYTMGVKEHTIFPEAADEELKDVFGLAITIVTSAKTKPEAQAFLDYLGFPFKK
jgi:large subunit ribosomal protein L5